MRPETPDLADVAGYLEPERGGIVAKRKATVGNPAAAEVRTRRNAKEVQRLILESARELFATKGYAGTSTREIAEHAGVYEKMIYRRFGSKAELFEAAVLEPFNEVVASYLDAWGAQAATGDASLEELADAFAPPLFRTMRDSRKLVLALMAAEEFHAEDFEGTQRTLAAEIQRNVMRMVPPAEIEVIRRSLYDVDVAPMVLISWGLIVGTALLEPALGLNEDDTKGRERLIEELSKFLLYGIAGRPRPETRAGESPAGLATSDIAQLLDRIIEAERRAVRAELELERLSATPVASPPATLDTRRETAGDAPTRRRRHG
jgi:AcrR family transcriptional regulator